MHKLIFFMAMCFSNIVYFIFAIFRKKNAVIFCLNYKRDLYKNITTLYSYLKNDNKYLIYAVTKNYLEEYKNIILLAKAKILVVDVSCRYVSQLSISRETKIIYLGHGGGLYKKMGYSLLELEGNLTRIKRNHGKYAYVICTSENVRSGFAEYFNIDRKNVLALGMPRTDAYYTLDCVRLRTKLCDCLTLDASKKIILYAPTFASTPSGRVNGIFLEHEKISDEFYERCSICYRGHPTLDRTSLPAKWTDLSAMPLEECLAAADVLVTDYSSILFDFAFFKRPMYLLVPEVVNSNQNKYLYIQPNVLMKSNVCKNTEALTRKIIENEYEKIDIWGNYMSACDGHVNNKLDLFINRIYKSVE